MKRARAEPFSRIAVTGPNGQLGHRLLESLGKRYPDATRIPLPRSDFDLSRPDTLADWLDEQQPSLILHAGAYTQVDLAETEAELCSRVNRDATLEIAKWCQENEVPLIYFSTDYIFSGDADFPYTPDSPRKPVNTYGRTKAEAEECLETLGLHCLIIRTQWVYDSRGKNFLRTMLKVMAEREKVTVVDDQIGSPTYAKDLAEATLDLAEFWLDWENPGTQIRHITNSGYTTWFHFAEAIREGASRRKLLRPMGDLLPIKTSQYKTPAARPLRGALDPNETLRDGVSIRSWKDALEDCLDELQRPQKQDTK